MTFTTIPFQTQMRAAAVDLLNDYASSASVKLQVYPGRPARLLPPTGFVDRIVERVVMTGPTMRQRFPTVVVTLVWGLFDSMEAVNQRDAFIDGFMDWVTSNYHAAGATTLIAPTLTEDLPGWQPSWLATDHVYFATELSLEGYAGG